MDQCVRLGMAITIIAMISAGLYHFNGRAGAVDRAFTAISYQR